MRGRGAGLAEARACSGRRRASKGTPWAAAAAGSGAGSGAAAAPGRLPSRLRPGRRRRRRTPRRTTTPAAGGRRPRLAPAAPAAAAAGRPRNPPLPQHVRPLCPGSVPTEAGLAASPAPRNATARLSAGRLTFDQLTGHPVVRCARCARLLQRRVDLGGPPRGVALLLREV